MTAIMKGSDIPPPKGARCARCMKPIKLGSFGGFCSSDCSEAEKQEVSQVRLRALVFDRDRGICASCGMDTEALRHEIFALRERFQTDVAARILSARVHQLVRLGFPRGPIERGESLWACDHVREVAASGPSTLANAQTLCLGCHSKKTKGFAKRRAAARKVRR